MKALFVKGGFQKQPIVWSKVDDETRALSIQVPSNQAGLFLTIRPSKRGALPSDQVWLSGPGGNFRKQCEESVSTVIHTLRAQCNPKAGFVKGKTYRDSSFSSALYSDALKSPVPGLFSVHCRGQKVPLRFGTPFKFIANPDQAVVQTDEEWPRC